MHTFCIILNNDWLTPSLSCTGSARRISGTLIVPTGRTLPSGVSSPSEGIMGVADNVQKYF